MNKEKLLTEYIKLEYSDLKPITHEQRNLIKNSLGFNTWCLNKELKDAIKRIFPFNLIYHGD